MSDAPGPLAEWPEDTCTVCPAQRLGPGCFDVVDGPGERFRFDPGRGWRVDRETGTPVCVHPFRVGLAPGAYDSGGVTVRSVSEGSVFVPSVEQCVLPAQADDLEAWFVAILRSAEPDQMVSALDHAETTSAQRFTGEEIVRALRRVLARGLSR